MDQKVQKEEEVEEREDQVMNLARYLFFLCTSPRPINANFTDSRIDISNMLHGVLSSEIEELSAENELDSDEVLAYLNHICEFAGLELVKLDLEAIIPDVKSTSLSGNQVYMIRTPNAIEDVMDNIEYAVTGLCIYLFQNNGPFPEKDLKKLLSSLRPYTRKTNGKNGKKRDFYSSNQLLRTFKGLVSSGVIWRIKKGNSITYTLSPKLVSMFPKDKREALHYQINQLLLKDELDSNSKESTPD